MLLLTLLFLGASTLATTTPGIDPKNCLCPEDYGYMFKEQNSAVCGVAYFPSSTADCFITTPEGKVEGRILCSSPKGTGTVVSNCDPDYRCLQRINKDGREIQVQSMEGLIKVGEEFGCVRAVEEIYNQENLCKQGQLARCVFLGETVNV